MRDLIIVSICVLIIAVRLSIRESNYEVGDEVVVSDSVRHEPTRFEYSQGVEIESLYVFLPLYPEIHYGDRIKVRGVADEENKLSNAEVVELTSEPAFLYRFRNKMVNVYDRSLPSPHAGLVAGMAIGSKSLLARGFWDKLKVSGTAHVVVASGMNVTLVAQFVASVCITFLSRPKALIIVFCGLWIYALFSGMDAPIVRASIMASIGLLGIVAGRIRYAWRSFIGAALIMLMIKPDWIGDFGFILSFVATGSLMLFERRVKQLLLKFRIPHVVLEDLSTSVSVQIGVAPILYFTFGYSNMWSPLINAAVLWTVVPITLIGGIGGIVGLIHPTLGHYILMIIYPLTWWFVKVVEITGSS